MRRVIELADRGQGPDQIGTRRLERAERFPIDRHMEMNPPRFRAAELFRRQFAQQGVQVELVNNLSVRKAGERLVKVPRLGVARQGCPRFGRS
jgi:hypothetical protein